MIILFFGGPKVTVNVRRADNVITVRVDEHNAVETAMRQIASNLAIGRAILLLLPILLATAAATHPGDGAGHVGHVRGLYKGIIRNPRRETVHSNIHEVDTSKIDIDLLNSVATQRHRTAKSISHFRFNENRVRWLTELKKIPDWTEGIVYWTYRDQRVQDNWSLLYAQNLAIKHKVPLYVVYCTSNTVWKMTLRQYKYIIEGLKEFESECQNLNIQFHFLHGSLIELLPTFVRKRKIGGIVVDFLPLRDYSKQIRRLVPVFNVQVPVIMVDAHNVVPAWVALIEKSTTSTRFQQAIDEKLREFLTEFPPVIKHPFNSSSELIPEPIDWELIENEIPVDRTVLPVPDSKVGYREGIFELEDFMKNRLRNYSQDSIDPMKNGLSNLSPWLHFGQISAQRVILEINRFANRYSVNAKKFKDEVLSRRELSDNFCFYNPGLYDKIQGAPYWAKSTIETHRKDKREYVYTRDDLEFYKTHDRLWNAAQLQMMIEGKMHRFLRMYWGKKILEWTETPENALANAIYLNNKYSLDGNDPNSYAGCMWAICGVHDRPWKKGADRPVIGSMRYMDLAWFQTKFDNEAYIKKYYDNTKKK